MSDNLTLRGLDGANPLAFLATLGVFALTSRLHPAATLLWRLSGNGYHPELSGAGSDETEFVIALHNALTGSSASPYMIDKRLPFSAATFQQALRTTARQATPSDRRDADLMAALGTEVHEDNKGNFIDTAFRMVRSGDAAGQGLPAYALAIRNNTEPTDLERTIFKIWDYKDNEFSLRWDPLEDQRYALRWYDPSPESNKKYSPRTMRGANVLALEGLAIMPVQPNTRSARTTGFQALERRREFFTWPIWDAAATIDVVRSLVALSDLQKRIPPRERLRSRGIVEIYRSERIAPNQYYKNFSPAIPA